MVIPKIRGALIPFITFCIIMGASVIVIAYGRGYRPDFGKNTIKPTGLVSATSDPIGAQVYIEGKLRTATNNSLNIDPGWYTVRIVKEGYIPWEKKLRIQGEVVTRADAFLFPTNPSLSPLTSVGIEHPILSPDGTKIAYTIPTSSQSDGVAGRRPGLWVYELVERPLGRNRDPQQIGISDSVFNFSNATMIWSPDSTQLMVDQGTNVRLYQVNRTDSYQDITAISGSILAQWNEEKKAKERQKLAAFAQEIIEMATSSAKIISFSPDETKILYEATAGAIIPPTINPPMVGTNSTEEVRTIEPGKIYVYDSREDKNYFVLDKSELPPPAGPVPDGTRAGRPTPTPARIKAQAAADRQSIAQIYLQQTNLHWFPTSRHLALTLEGKIDIMEFDRTNWVTVYSGPFTDGFIAPWPNGSRIIIMTNLNPNVSRLPNLYTVNLR